MMKNTALRTVFLLTLVTGLAMACAIPGMQPAPTQPPARVQPTAPPITPRLSTPAASSLPPLAGSEPLRRPEKLQIGLNFIRFYWADGRQPGALNTTTPYLQPEWIFRDFKELGVQTYRQFVRADLMWDVVEKSDNQWDFTAADAVLRNPDFEPIVTLFAMQYSSPTPPWETDPAKFQKTVGKEATDYLETVVKRYAPYVKYWELGNEMDHWRAFDPGEKGNTGGDRGPSAVPAGGFSPREQGVFLAQAAAIVRKNDPDAVIVLPGISGLDDYPTETWLGGVIEGGGKDFFDIMNYHYYSSWERYTILRSKASETFKKLGIDQKPVWGTETGVTSDAALTLRTNYPNSPETQAAEIFRRIVQGYGHGDALEIWHTYISNTPSPNVEDTWRLYGIRTGTSEPQLAFYAFKLLAKELIPFERAEALNKDPRAINLYRLTLKGGAVKYVVWGTGNWTVPSGMSSQASVVPEKDGVFTWKQAKPGDVVRLTAVPVLVK